MLLILTTQYKVLQYHGLDRAYEIKTLVEEIRQGPDWHRKILKDVKVLINKP